MALPAVKKGTLIGFPSSLKEVKAVPTPKATSTWKPYPFGDFVELINDRLQANGYKVLERHYSLTKPKKARDAKQLFGVFTITPDMPKPKGGDGVSIIHPDWCQALGFRTSHNKTLPNAFVGGQVVSICTNLGMYGEEIRLRKHTSNSFADLPVILDEMLDNMSVVFKKQEEFVKGCKSVKLNTSGAHDLMMHVVTEQAFPVSKLLQVVEAWDVERGVLGGDDGAPSRFGYTISGDTAWDLLNCFTWVNRSRTAENQIDDSARITKVFSEHLALA